MIEQYINRFLAAQSWTNRNTDRIFNYPLRLEPHTAIDMGAIVDALTLDFSDFINTTDTLPGHCFLIVREVSYVLFELKIKHVVTIGDVILPSGPYVGMSRQKLKKELREGYKISCDDRGYPVGVPADAHAWITLESGQIIDATILAAINRRAGGSSLELQDCFYYFGRVGGIEHIPFMTGFAYHYNVLTDPRDALYNRYMQWYDTYFGFMQKYGKKR